MAPGRSPVRDACRLRPGTRRTAPSHVERAQGLRTPRRGFSGQAATGPACPLVLDCSSWSLPRATARPTCHASAGRRGAGGQATRSCHPAGGGGPCPSRARPRTSPGRPADRALAAHPSCRDAPLARSFHPRGLALARKDESWSPRGFPALCALSDFSQVLQKPGEDSRVFSTKPAVGLTAGAASSTPRSHVRPGAVGQRARAPRDPGPSPGAAGGRRPPGRAAPPRGPRAAAGPTAAGPAAHSPPNGQVPSSGRLSAGPSVPLSVHRKTCTVPPLST